MVTVTSTSGSDSNDNNGAVPDAKGGGAELIGVDGDNKDCGEDGRVLVGGSRAAATATETTIN
jgi:hypothetical protein